jgi:hydroxyethylthiazole kinase-like uncharacterized protein yjeF
MEINSFSYLFSGEESKKLDEFAVEYLSTKGEVLMSLASGSIFSKYYNQFKDHTIKVIAGNGNNGGDGIVLAYLFFQSNCDVEIYYKEGSSSFEYLFHKKIAIKSNIQFHPLESLVDSVENCKNNKILIIDSLFGTGLNGKMGNEYLLIFKYLNDKLKQKKIRILNIDTPSGFLIDNPSNSVPIDMLCEIGCKKIINQFAKIYSNEYSFFSIGFPLKEFVSQKKWNYFMLDDPEENHFKESLEKKNESNKYTNGSCSFFGGSKGMSGAIILSQTIFHALGGGISCIYTDASDTIKEVLKEDPSKMIKEFPEDLKEDTFYKKSNSLVIGPGLSLDAKLPKDLLQNKTFTILDAGMIQRSSTLPIHELTLLTPHAGELNSLAGKKLETYEQKIQFIQSYCLEYNTNILLKGPVNILSTNSGEIFIRTFSNPKLAVMGTGDLLTGILAYFYNRLGNLLQTVQYSLFLLEQSSNIPKKNPTAFEILKFLSERL